MKTQQEILAMIAAMESELINMPDEKSHNKKKQIAHNNTRDHLRIQRASLQWALLTTPPASGATTMEQGAEGSSAVTMEAASGAVTMEAASGATTMEKEEEKKVRPKTPHYIAQYEGEEDKDDAKGKATE